MENNSNILANFSLNGDFFVSPNDTPPKKNIGFLVTKFQEKKKKTHHILYKKREWCFNFFGLDHVFNSQIRLNHLMGDCHFSYIANLKKKKKHSACCMHVK
jgi:hypothetical protein